MKTKAKDWSRVKGEFENIRAAFDSAVAKVADFSRELHGLQKRLASIELPEPELDPIVPDMDSIRFMGTKEVVSKVGLSRTSIFFLVRDGKFPASVKLSNNRVGWKSDAIQAWMDSRGK